LRVHRMCSQWWKTIHEMVGQQSRRRPRFETSALRCYRGQRFKTPKKRNVI
jgi:hypothetical protein